MYYLQANLFEPYVEICQYFTPYKKRGLKKFVFFSIWTEDKNRIFDRDLYMPVVIHSRRRRNDIPLLSLSLRRLSGENEEMQRDDDCVLWQPQPFKFHFHCVRPNPKLFTLPISPTFFYFIFENTIVSSFTLFTHYICLLSVPLLQPLRYYLYYTYKI